MLVTKEFANELLRYGEYIADYEYTGIADNSFNRIRIIQFNKLVYLHHMKNGDVVECKLIGKEK